MTAETTSTKRTRPRRAKWLVLLAVLIAGVGGSYSYRSYQAKLPKTMSEAITAKRYDLLEQMISREAYEENLRFAAERAIRNRDNRALAILLKHVDVNSRRSITLRLGKERQADSLIKTAVVDGDHFIVQALVDAGAKLDQKSAGADLLYEAVSRGHRQVLEKLLESGIFERAALQKALNYVAEYSSWDRPLRQEMDRIFPRPWETDDFDELRKLEQKRYKIARKHLVARGDFDYRNIVRLLVEHGADLEKPVSEYGGPILLEAAQNGRYELVQTLLDLGADPNGRDYFGRSAIHAVASRAASLPYRPSLDDYPSYVITLSRLLNAGADPNATSRSGGSPLHTLAHAMTHGSWKGMEQAITISEMLLKAGSDPTIVDSDGQFPDDIVAAASRKYFRDKNDKGHTRFKPTQPSGVCSLLGRVIGENGEPIAGAKVLWGALGSNESDCASTVTTQAGRYGLESNRVVLNACLTIRADGYVPIYFDRYVRPNDRRIVKLSQRPGVISGTVLYLNDEPVKNAQVSVAEPTSAVRPWYPFNRKPSSGETGGDGSFRIDGTIAVLQERTQSRSRRFDLIVTADGESRRLGPFKSAEGILVRIPVPD